MSELERRRFPSPWVTIPTLLGGILGGSLGFSLTRILCTSGTCLTSSIATGVLGSLVAAGGFATVAILALRSIQEWQGTKDAGQPPSGAEREVPESD
jgi:hypothetical protein